MKSITFSLTTDATGAKSITQTLCGKLIGVEVAIGTMTTPTISVTKTVETGTTVTYFSKASCASGLYHPRAYAQTTGAVDLTYDGTRKIETEFAMCGEIIVAAASAGDTKTGTVTLYYE